MSQPAAEGINIPFIAPGINSGGDGVRLTHTRSAVLLASAAPCLDHDGDIVHGIADDGISVIGECVRAHETQSSRINWASIVKRDI